MCVSSAHRAWLLVVAAALGACDDAAGTDATDDTTGASAPTWRPLVSASAWQLATPADDPFAAERPPTQTCDLAGVTVEALTDGPALEVDTGLCDWATVQQAALSSADVGDHIRVRLWHDELDAPEAPTTGTVFVVVDGETLVQIDVEIPAAAALVVEEVELPIAIELSTPVYAHVRNHGSNTWSIAEIAVLTD